MARIAVAIIVASLFPAMVAAEPIKVFLMIGASNMHGVANADGLAPPWDTPQDDVWIWQNDFGDNVGWTSLRPGFGNTDNNFGSGGNHLNPNPNRPDEDRFGPELSFGRSIADAFPESQIAILKHADGGRDLETNFNPSNTGPAGRENMWAGLVEKTDQALKVFEDVGLEYSIAGMVMYQGAKDARNLTGVEIDNYDENLPFFIQGVRDQYNEPELPFVITHLPTFMDPIRYPGRYDIRAVQADVAASDPFISLTEISDLERREDGVHFDHIDMLEIGQRYADTYVELTSETCNSNTLGDIDGNGKVDFADFLVLSNNFGMDVEGHKFGDIDCNGSVEFADFLTLSNNFGSTVQAAATVPEPSGRMVLALGLMLFSAVGRDYR